MKRKSLHVVLSDLEGEYYFVQAINVKLFDM